jgi:hypothetical protein
VEAIKMQQQVYNPYQYFLNFARPEILGRIFDPSNSYSPQKQQTA